jgi:hypothetical protein
MRRVVAISVSRSGKRSDAGSRVVAGFPVIVESARFAASRVIAGFPSIAGCGRVARSVRVATSSRVAECVEGMEVSVMTGIWVGIN